MKKMFSIFTMILTVVILLTGCGNSGGGNANDSTNKSTKTTDNTDEKIKTIRFYGSDSEYNQKIVAGFESENPDIKVEIVPVDFTAAEQVIKTGIASGDPVDVSFFWGNQITAFTDDDMAYDLTSFLTENNNEWLNTFVPAYIDCGKVDDKYYAISYQPVLESIYVNKDLFEQYNVPYPTTWEELIKACEIFKENGIYGVGNWSGQNHQLLQFGYQYMANDNTLEKYVSGQGDFSENEGLKKCLENWVDIYEKGYWYPGEGALTSTKDQTQAAWYQGKIAMLFDASSNAGEYDENTEFEVSVIPHPYVETGGKYALNTITNALFIPANAKNPDEAVKFIKYYTSDTAIQEIINSGRLPATIAMQDKVDSQILQDLLAMTIGDNVVGYRQMQGLSSELNAFMQNDLMGMVCTGTSVQEAMEQMESIREATVELD